MRGLGAIAYYSRKLLPQETRYLTIKKECLASVAGLQHFEFLPRIPINLFSPDVTSSSRQITDELSPEKMRKLNGHLICGGPWCCSSTPSQLPIDLASRQSSGTWMFGGGGSCGGGGGGGGGGSLRE